MTMRTMGALTVALLLPAVLLGLRAARAPAALAEWAGPEPPVQDYYAYVCAESDDEVALVRYGPEGLAVVRTIRVGSFPNEIEGPHGIAVDPDGRHWYVSLAHGLPFGSVHKYETGSDVWVGDVTLGLFPATLDVSPATGLLFAVNFNLHGGMEPGSISAVEVETMVEVARIDTGVMPHGSRLSRDGARHYSVNMMGGDLVELDALGFGIARRLPLGDGVQPTWVTTPTRDDIAYVTGNNIARVFEVDLSAWRIRRTFETGAGPYNLAVTPDGATLVATYKSGDAVGFWDLARGVERARTPTTRSLPHGVAVTPDGEYAFVTLEGVGGEPGTVEVYDIDAGARVAAVDIGKQAGGIAFWKMEEPGASAP